MSSPDKANQAFARHRLTLEWLRTESSGTGSVPFLHPEVDARAARSPRALGQAERRRPSDGWRRPFLDGR
jgi:hypothetical protein